MSNKCNFVLKRQHGSIGFTIGSISYLESRVCYILEDQEREKKIKGETAIPCGIYEVAITMSPKFKVLMPILLDVPDYTGVRIHTGNDADDTEGCLITGTEFDKKLCRAKYSHIAYNMLFPLIEVDIERNGRTWIAII
jgi:hypothetical protein